MLQTGQITICVVFQLVCVAFPGCLFNAVRSVHLVILHEERPPIEGEVKASLSFTEGFVRVLLDQLIKLSSS